MKNRNRSFSQMILPLQIVIYYLMAILLAPQGVANADVLANNPAADTTQQDTQSETTIVLGAGGNVIVSFNDSGSALTGNRFTGFSLSNNGGATFTDQGVLPTDTNGDQGDPVLARDETTGTIYLATLMWSVNSGIQVFRSLNNGQTFNAPVNGAPGFGGGDFLDKEWIAVDNFSGVGRGNLYLVYRNFPAGGQGTRPAGIYLSRSIDGGNNWGAAIQIIQSNNVQGAYVTVGPDHAVYAFWRDQGTRQVQMRRSTDLGVNFNPAVTVATLNGTAQNGDLGLNGGFRSNSFPHAAVNPTNGDIYAVFNDIPVLGGVDRANVFFTQSANGGTTWSTPLRINDDTTTNDQWMPTIAVTPNGLHLFIGFYDRRRDPANALIDRYGAIGNVDLINHTVKFGHNIRISTQAFPAVIGQDPILRSTYMGDYDQAVADNNFFYMAWGDNRNADAWFTNQPDVRFVRIPVNSPAIISIITNLLLD